MQSKIQPHTTIKPDVTMIALMLISKTCQITGTVSKLVSLTV